jgi:hypothetical protein
VLVEYSWDEQTQIGAFVYEEPVALAQKYQPLHKPEVTDELKLSYYADLLHWIRTQS